jgi:hypothetical protein
MSLQVLTSVSMEIRAFRDIVPCSLVVVDRRFRVTYFIIRAMMEAVHTSETSVYYNETIRRNITEDSNLF